MLVAGPSMINSELSSIKVESVQIIDRGLAGFFIIEFAKTHS